MIDIETNQRATVALRSLFNGVDGDEADAKPIRARLSKATFHNYVSQVGSAGFAKAVKDDPTDKRLTSKIILTDTGKQVLDKQVVDLATGKQIFVTPKTDKLAESSDVVTLDESTRVTDAFNRQNKTWKWVLVRKDTPM